MQRRNLIPKIVLAAPILFLVFAFVKRSELTPETVELTAAIAAGNVDADVVSNGKYSGVSVDLTLTNTTSRPLSILIPGGTAYVPDEDGEQTLIQLEDELFVLEAKKKVVKSIAAFCSEASDSSPSEGGNFTVSKTKNKKILDLVAYIKGKKVQKIAFQDAVWAITDGNSVTNIQAEDKITQDLRQYVADLTGQKNEWYTSPQLYTINPETRNINSETVVIQGEISFPSDGVTPIRQVVIDKDGNVKFTMPESTPKKSTNVRMTFRVRVQGWEVGEYTVKITQGDVELKTFPFNV